MNNLDLETGKIINLQVISNSKENIIQKIDTKNYKLKTIAPAIKGKANKEIKKIFKNKGFNINIIKGQFSNHKIVEII